MKNFAENEHSAIVGIQDEGNSFEYIPLRVDKLADSEFMGTTILTRLGNKRKIAEQILKVMQFRPHKNYIEPFCGTLAVFMAKPLSTYSFLNDFDQDVRNLYEVMINYCPKDEFGLPNLDLISDQHPLYRAVELLIFNHQGVWNDDKKVWREKYPFENPIIRAAKFLFFSNYGYLGKPETLRIGQNNNKKQILEAMKPMIKKLTDGKVSFYAKDCVEFIDRFIQEKFDTDGNPMSGTLISFRSQYDFDDTLVYADPPYIKTDQVVYNTPLWREENFDKMCDKFNTFAKFVKPHREKGKAPQKKKKDADIIISEFAHPFVLEKAKQLGWQVTEIGDRRNLGNVRTEILITNFDAQEILSRRESKTNSLF